MPNTIDKRNDALEQLANAYRMGMCNKTIRDLALKVSFLAIQVDHELRLMTADEMGVTEKTMEDLLLRPHYETKT